MSFKNIHLYRYIFIIALRIDQVEEKEDRDIDFLVKTAADRARLFAERYEAAVVGLQWPMSGSLG